MLRVCFFRYKNAKTRQKRSQRQNTVEYINNHRCAKTKQALQCRALFRQNGGSESSVDCVRERKNPKILNRFLFYLFSSLKPCSNELRRCYTENSANKIHYSSKYGKTAGFIMAICFLLYQNACCKRRDEFLK